MKQTLNAISETFNQAPHATVSSNEPYAVGQAPEQAALRAELTALYREHPTDWPDFNYPKLNEADLWRSERIMQDVLMQLEAAEGSDIEIAMMYEQVATKLAEVYRHLEIIRGLGRTGVRRALSRERAGDMTLDIFGEPDQAVFDDMLHADIVTASRPLDRPNKELSAIRQEFLELVGDKAKHYTPEGGKASYELEDTTIETLRGDLYQLFPELETIPAPEQKSYTAKQSLVRFDATLAAIGLADKGWTSRNDGGKAARSSSATKEIVVGENRDDFTDSTIITVPAHEALAHCLRSQNASEQASPIRQRPLPGYLAFEEGFGVAIEQILSGKKRIGGVAYYLSLGLQLGKDRADGTRRSFEEIDEILWRRNLLSKQNITSRDIITAKKTSLQQTLRTTRGGALDARDISYADGARKANQWLNWVASQEPDERLRLLQWVLSGKFDPTNPSHVAAFTDKPDGE